MAEYIEREEAKRFFENIDAGRRGCPTLLTPIEFAEYLDEIEPADVAEVRHGKWVRMEDDFVYWYACSECKERIPKTEYGNDYWSDYCPRCGPIMDLGDDEE